MAKSANGSKATPRNVIEHVRQLHGTAAPEPGQGKRTANSGAGGTANTGGRGTKEQK